MRADLGGVEPAYRRRLWTVAVWGVALVIPLWLLATPVAAPWFEPEPSGLVREYLEAVRAGDVDRALTIVRHRPTGEEATFLTADALDRRWDLGRVSVVEETTSYATVEAEIIADGGAGSTGRFELSKEEFDGDWRFDAPLLEVQFSSGPFRYLEVNGVTVPSTPVDSGETPVYLLFPGVYRFYSDVPGLLDVDTASAPFLPDSRQGIPRHPTRLQVEPSSPTLAVDAERRIQAAVNAYLDVCAAKMLDTAAAGCPFGVFWIPDPRDEGGSRLDEFGDVAWRVERYPVVTATVGWDALLITHREEGAAKFTANGVDGDDHVPVTADRPIAADRLAAVVLPGGELQIVGPWIRDDPFQWAT